MFRTEIKIPLAPFYIGHSDKILMSGSCFSEAIGKKLQESGFNVLLHPHGILFHPLPIANSLCQIIEKRITEKSRIIYNQGKWHSLDHHGSFSFPDVDNLLSAIREDMERAHGFLCEASLLIITLGTSWGWKYKETGDIVANCHKIPSIVFEKILVGHNETVNAWEKVILLLRLFNPRLRVVFTISPVRHWREGAAQNQLSKSHLIIAAHTLCEKFDNCFYFPSYEIVLDDLRDYRFFSEDMIHPNSTATNYVWKKFCAWSMREETCLINTEIEKLSRIFNHRVRNPGEENETLREETTRKIELLILKGKAISTVREI
ncbi:MAG: GSCFA domain-containing protein [Crocinitomicaceae bacterium]|nr:GSCFA domain-containing protein [Crocinitomicaceae bacterium]